MALILTIDVNSSCSIRRAFMLLPLLGGGLLAQAQSMEKQSLLGLDELRKLTDAKQLDVVLDYVSTHPSSKWPKIYSAEYCSEKLKGKEQNEALQIRKLAEELVAGLDSYQDKMGSLSQDEFVKSMNRLFDLRDVLDQSAYGNILLELTIDRVATVRIAERAILYNDDLQVLTKLLKRKKDWLGEWRTICQMIEEEEGRKIFDYAGMEKVSPREIFNGRKEGTTKLISKWLGGAFNPEDMSINLTTFEMFRERDFNSLLWLIEGVENPEGGRYLPALIEFKQRGGDFNGLDEKWEDRFDKLMSDYVYKSGEGNWGGISILDFVEIVKEIASGEKINWF